MLLGGDDDEVSGRDTLQGPFRRRSEVPLKLVSRSVGAHFLGVGCWVLGVGCSRAATTRSLYRDFDNPLGGPDRGRHDGIVAVAVSAL